MLEFLLYMFQFAFLSEILIYLILTFIFVLVEYPKKELFNTFYENAEIWKNYPIYKFSYSETIPKDYEEVKNTIKGHMYVISRNLHGLILGWREGAMCLCLCNERKFVSFMKQIGHEDCIVDVYKTKAKDIFQMFSNLTTLNENHVEIQKSISEEVIKACKDTFNI